MPYQIPQFVTEILDRLKAQKYEAYIVGGCIRDLILGREPKDWDITTNALPEEIQKLFPKSKYENKFGTVLVFPVGDNGHEGDQALNRLHKTDHQPVEVTTYRTDLEYADRRHPEVVKFGVSLKEDLERRDFTVNAFAYDGKKLVDLFQGQKDLKDKLIRTVGDPDKRFAEDALRLMRAIRFMAELDFTIEKKTLVAIKKNRDLITVIAKERIRDELLKILGSDNAFKGFWFLDQTGLLDYLLPELQKGKGVTQNWHHDYTVWFHSLVSLQACTSSDPIVRLATLLHDLGKPQTKAGDGPKCTFYNHEIVSAKLAVKALKRLKFGHQDIARIENLVKNHMFYYDFNEISDSGVRRLIRRVGRDNLDDLIALRIGDRIGSGCQLEKTRRLLELEERIAEVQKDPINERMLEVDGNDVMRLLKIKPSRKIGVILNQLLEEVLDDPKKNTKYYLEQQIKKISPEVSGKEEIKDFNPPKKVYFSKSKQ